MQRSTRPEGKLSLKPVDERSPEFSECQDSCLYSILVSSGWGQQHLLFISSSQEIKSMVLALFFPSHGRSIYLQVKVRDSSWQSRTFAPAPVKYSKKTSPKHTYKYSKARTAVLSHKDTPLNSTKYYSNSTQNMHTLWKRFNILQFQQRKLKSYRCFSGIKKVYLMFQIVVKIKYSKALLTIQWDKHIQCHLEIFHS